MKSTNLSINHVLKAMGAAGVVSLALIGGQSAIAGVASTKHNLGTTGSGSNANQFSGTDQVCVFCHTPHGATVSDGAPLWNRSLSLASTYTTYNSTGASSTLDGATTTVGSVSVLCLSCHDGTQALNTLNNVPGSGMTSTAWTSATWTASGSLTSGKFSVGSGANLTPDLQNDHPIGIQYGGGITGDVVYPSTATVAATLFKDDAFQPLRSKTLNSQPVWWVDVDGNTLRNKEDMLLYTRVIGGVQSASVECASCHDPHSSEGLFLRQSATNSGICLSCHVK